MLFGEWPLKGDHFNEGTGPKDTYGTLDPCSRSNITVARPEGHLGNTPVTERERERKGGGGLYHGPRSRSKLGKNVKN